MCKKGTITLSLERNLFMLYRPFLLFTAIFLPFTGCLRYTPGSAPLHQVKDTALPMYTPSSTLDQEPDLLQTQWRCTTDNTSVLCKLLKPQPQYWDRVCTIKATHYHNPLLPPLGILPLLRSGCTHMYVLPKPGTLSLCRSVRHTLPCFAMSNFF